MLIEDFSPLSRSPSCNICPSAPCRLVGTPTLKPIVVCSSSLLRADVPPELSKKVPSAQVYCVAPGPTRSGKRSPFMSIRSSWLSAFASDCVFERMKPKPKTFCLLLLIFGGREAPATPGAR